MWDGFNIVLGFSHVTFLLSGLILGFALGRLHRRKDNP